MTALAPDTMDGVSVLFRAFADPTRLRILHLLRGEELCVGDLVAALGLPQPKVSRHLAVLREAELVVSREEGTWRYYALAPARAGFHRKLLDCLATCFRDVGDFAEDAGRLAGIRRSGGCC